MMLKEKSNPWARLKYLYVLPLAAIAVTAFARPEVSEKVEEISAVKVNDLAETVETKTEENDVKAPVDTTKTDVVVVAGYRKEEKDSLFRFKRNGMSVSMTKTSPKETPLIIINGKESDMTVVNALDPKRIKSISVTDAKDAMKNYGERGKGGVMDIQLYSEEKFQSTKVVLKPDVSKKLDALNGNTKNWGVHFRSANGGDPLVIIDGKEVLGEDPLSKISPDRIRSISVLKDKSAQAIYGDKGKSGVILIDMLTDEEYQIRQNKVIVVGKSSKDTITLKADSITIIPNK